MATGCADSRCQTIAATAPFSPRKPGNKACQNGAKATNAACGINNLLNLSFRRPGNCPGNSATEHLLLAPAHDSALIDTHDGDFEGFGRLYATARVYRTAWLHCGAIACSAALGPGADRAQDIQNRAHKLGSPAVLTSPLGKVFEKSFQQRGYTLGKKLCSNCAGRRDKLMIARAGSGASGCQGRSDFSDRLSTGRSG